MWLHWLNSSGFLCYILLGNSNSGSGSSGGSISVVNNVFTYTTSSTASTTSTTGMVFSQYFCSWTFIWTRISINFYEQKTNPSFIILFIFICISNISIFFQQLLHLQPLQHLQQLQQLPHRFRIRFDQHILYPMRTIILEMKNLAVNLIEPYIRKLGNKYSSFATLF